MAFRANDAVHVESLGEDWILAADERDGKVVCAGWPQAIVDASECTLARATTDEGRIDMLMQVASSAGDLRGRWARLDLQAMNIEVPPLAQGSLF